LALVPIKVQSNLLPSENSQCRRDQRFFTRSVGEIRDLVARERGRGLPMEAVRQQERAEGKRPRVEAAQPDGGNQLGDFDVLPQDLVVSILAAVSSSAEKPADLFSAMLV